MMISYTSVEIRGAGWPFLGLTCSYMSLALRHHTHAHTASQPQGLAAAGNSSSRQVAQAGAAGVQNSPSGSMTSLDTLTSWRRTSGCSCGGWRPRSWLPAAKQKGRAGQVRSAAAGRPGAFPAYQCIVWVHGRHGCCRLCCELVQLARCDAPVDAHGHLLGHQHLHRGIQELNGRPEEPARRQRAAGGHLQGRRTVC